ncbi:hypothetical protein JOC86_003963 [Bacillus pakistanensis]|uniref:Uncharacterized protein n=1 Tax=Rossellomorea pakistanensis TaxID=992288 RepID=A0ABS2NHT9_9BACI|nr:hypothetical protein [Bacillus pakistanensis]MBM7587390.1 hypothetical protein [Bacillus pakistanensis]
MDEKESQRLNEERQRKHEEANVNKEKSQLIQPLQATPPELAEAIVSPGTQLCLTGSSITANSPLQGEVFNIPLQGFPTNGNSFGGLSSGIAADASIAGGTCSTCFNPAGDDTISLDLTFDVPTNPGNLTFDWKFGAEESPITSFNDFFNVLVNAVPIPGFPVTVNTAVLSPPVPNDVCYSLISPMIQTASFDLTPFAGQTITVTFQVSYFGSVFGDCVVDSAAFIDNLQIEGCEPPTITCPDNITQENDPSQCGANVTYPPPTVSGGVPPIDVVCTPASGSFFI